MQVTRRTVLAGIASALATGCGVGGGGSASFPLGVAAGDVTEDSAILWTKYTGVDALQLRVWAEIGDVMTAPLMPVEGRDGGFIILDLKSLLPGQWYRFRFEAGDGELSPLGRFRTALAPDALETVTLGATSCIKEGHSYAALGHASRREDLDAFIFLGDTVYTDGAATLSEYRDKWAGGLGGDDYQALRGSTSLVALWDDHEVRNNWEGDTVDPLLLSNARRAWHDHQPFRRQPDPNRYWRSLRWGRTAELFVLDGRSERNRAAGQYLSEDQLDWVIEGVNRSDAVFKLVLNAVPIGSFDSAFFAPFNDDNWQNFPRQRTRLLEGLERSNGGDGVIIVSGDFHLGCFGRVAPSGPGSRLFEALVGPGANAPNPLPTYPRGDPWEFSTALSSYSTFQLDPNTRQATVKYHSGDGRTLFERTMF